MKTNRYKMAAYLTAPLTAAALLLASCGGDKSVNNKDGDNKDNPPAPETGNLFPAELITTDAPEGALSVVEARAKGKAGAEIVLRGKVGGRVKPFQESSALLILADEKAITSCDDMEDDHCETPWDYCCDTPEAIKASTLTVRVLGEDGKTIPANLKGLAGMKELSRLIIKGTVDEASTDANMIVNATSIHVEKP